MLNNENKEVKILVLQSIVYIGKLDIEISPVTDGKEVTENHEKEFEIIYLITRLLFLHLLLTVVLLLEYRYVYKIFLITLEFFYLVNAGDHIVQLNYTVCYV